MNKGFIFGKFLPFHKGHEALIRFAMANCDRLTVLVCCSDKETIDGATRASWIERSFEGQKKPYIFVFNYSEAELPNTSVSSEEVSKIWAGVFERLVPAHTLLFTSEPYGNMVAVFMGIRHIMFDQLRQIVPVSASAITNDLWANWQYLPDSVRSHYAIKVVIAGTESTGKSTLAGQLADHYDCSIVTEAGRDIIPDSKEFEFKDLYTVASEHARRIKAAMYGDSPLIIIDTDVCVTISYGRYIFSMNMQVDAYIYELNRADLYLYLNNDVPHVQDGTRFEQENRNALDISHRSVFTDFNIKPVEIKGNWEERYKQAKHYIDLLLKNHDKDIKNYPNQAK